MSQTNDDVTSVAVGKRVEQARKLRDMSQAGLAKLLDLTGSAIQVYESGRSLPPLDRLKALAGVLDCDLGWLALGRGEPPVAEGGSRTARLRVDPDDADAAVRRYDPVRGTTVFLRDPAFFIEPPRKKYERGTPRIVSHFPCSEASFALTVWERRVDPICQICDIIILDPERKLTPGDLVVIRVSEPEPHLCLGRYRSNHRGGFELAATSEDWASIQLPATFEPNGPIRLLGVVSEISRQQPI